MSNIIDFNTKKTHVDIKNELTIEDIFNLFLIFKHDEGPLETFYLDTLMQSLGKYKDIERFNSIYQNVALETNENGEKIINLKECITKKIQEKVITENSLYEMEFIILGSDEYFENLKKSYDKNIISLFSNLMFNINNDLQYGLDGWKLLFEDEYIDVPNYPGVVTGEFIGEKKDRKVMKKVKKMAIEKLKNMYE